MEGNALVIDAGTGWPMGMTRSVVTASTTAKQLSPLDQDAWLFSQGKSAFWLDPQRWTRTPINPANQLHEPFWMYIPKTASSGLLDD